MICGGRPYQELLKGGFMEASIHYVSVTVNTDGISCSILPIWVLTTFMQINELPYRMRYILLTSVVAVLPCLKGEGTVHTYAKCACATMWPCPFLASSQKSWWLPAILEPKVWLTTNWWSSCSISLYFCIILGKMCGTTPCSCKVLSGWGWDVPCIPHPWIRPCLYKQE